MALNTRPECNGENPRPRGRHGTAIARRWAIAALVLAATLIVLGKLAGFGFNRRAPARTAPATPPVQAELLAGEWSGSWASTQSSMGDALRGTIDKQPDGTYRARFDAVFAKVFSHKSTVTLKVKDPAARPWQFTGEEDLGLLNGGVCKYEGHADGSAFVCNYVSFMDKGTFQMKQATPSKR